MILGRERNNEGMRQGFNETLGIFTFFLFASVREETNI